MEYRVHCSRLDLHRPERHHLIMSALIALRCTLRGIMILSPALHAVIIIA